MMKRSKTRILITHTGSLPRPTEVQELLYAQERDEPFDQAIFEERVRSAVQATVRQQVSVGIDIVNDGEMSKISYATCVKHRLTGFSRVDAPRRSVWADLEEFPAYAQRLFQPTGRSVTAATACTSPVNYVGTEVVQQGIAHLQAAWQGVVHADVFMTAASPGIISFFLENRYYPSHEAYVFALADAMKQEYDAISQAGLLLQVDCPDLAAGRSTLFAHAPLEEFRRWATANIEALNYAVRDIPADRMRLHLCWGNYEGPHHHDVPLREIIDLVLQARPVGLSFEAANPRHEHEWAVFEQVKLPGEKVLIPGTLDSTTNFIKHPELVAQRIVRFASLVGRERVIAGTDCGFATFADSSTVDPDIAWAKLHALAEGARLASQCLW
jgi:5-methyltetrahydropteroyltriglutamate--homocysteine methyltransferase